MCLFKHEYILFDDQTIYVPRLGTYQILKLKKKKSNEHDFNRPKCTLMNLNIACKNTPHISSSYIRGFIPKSKLNK